MYQASDTRTGSEQAFQNDSSNKMVLLKESESRSIMEWKDFWYLLLNYTLQIESWRQTDALVTRCWVNQAKQQAIHNQQSGRGNGNNTSGWGGGRGHGAGRGNASWQPCCAQTQTIAIPANVNASMCLLTWEQQNEVRERC